jgi:hypothetical protein
MSDEQNDEQGTERENNLGDLANDAGHAFDQTNGMADGLVGDDDAPEHQRDGAAGDGDGAGFIAAPAPGTQMAGGVVPAAAEREPEPDDDEDGNQEDSGSPTI